MKKALTYLFIFVLAANMAAFSIIYLTSPFIEHGQSNTQLVLVFLITSFIALTLTIGFIISVIKTFMPSHKLPHLLIRDSLVLSGLISLGITGLLVLQLLRATTVVNVLLWLVIVAASIWLTKSLQQAVEHNPENTRLPGIHKRNKNR